MTHGQSAGTGDRNTGRGPGAACAWLAQEIEKESDQAPRTGRRQQTEGCWREPRPSGLAGCVRRLPRAACQNTPRAAGLRAPPHGPPAGRSRFLPGRWLASRRPCPTEPGGSVFTCYRTWPQRCVLSTTVKSPPKFEERGHGPRFSVRAASGPCCRGARGLGGRVTVTLGK